MNILDINNNSYNVLRKIGEGSQGTTYLLEGEKYLVKLFNKISNNLSIKSTINFLINLGLDKNFFAIPLKQITQPKSGYIAEFASGMEALNNLKIPVNTQNPIEWYNNSGGLLRRYKILIKLSALLRTLHGKGLAYCDLSPSNVFISEKTEKDNVFLIDLDNLRYKTNIFDNIYTPFYGAPEIVNNTAPNSTFSDCYSFAVIAYELLTLNHPLIGDYVSNGEPEIEDEALSGRIPWVDHSSDSINERTTGFTSNKVIPKQLFNLFKRNFEDGLNEAMKRPTMAEWFDGLTLALNELLKCGNEQCGFFYPYNNFKKCTFCNREPQNLTKIQLRRWEETEFYNKETNTITSSFKIEPTIYEEILLDENTEKDITALNFLITEKIQLEAILNIKQIVDNNENKLLLSPHNSFVFNVSPRTGLEIGKESIVINAPKKIRIVDKNQPDKQKYMLHLKELNQSQRILTID